MKKEAKQSNANENENAKGSMGLEDTFLDPWANPAERLAQKPKTESAFQEHGARVAPSRGNSDVRPKDPTSADNTALEQHSRSQIQEPEGTEEASTPFHSPEAHNASNQYLFPRVSEWLV